MIIRLGVKKSKLHFKAIAKLQGKVEKGRVASSSIVMLQKAIVEASAKRSSSRKG